MCETRGLDVADWDLLLPEAVLLINNQVNKSLKYSPFKFVFGYEGRLPIDNYYNLEAIGDVIPPDVVQKDAKANRYDAQIAYKKEHDKKANTKIELKVGDTVLLKRNFGKYPKMAVKWLYGPYKLIKKIGPVNWGVANKDNHEKVYHQDLLKPAGISTDPNFIVQHKPYTLSNKQTNRGKINITSSTESENSPAAVPIRTIDNQVFRDNVFQERAPVETVNRTASGRISRPVLGSRLIDQLLS